MSIPGWVIDQFAEYRASFDDILKVGPVGAAVGMSLDMTNPLSAIGLIVAAASAVDKVLVVIDQPFISLRSSGSSAP
ncbi:MAG: hypothetical protein VX911_04030 [Candidatus Latescibacterota bacterium]|nr:hypothetical protein [Candidatus Latescibacterota bacterium]